MEIRPRTTGEILDDAWRLALSDAPTLLLFATLFLIPAFVAVLLLLAEPAPSGFAQCLLPALAATLLPLTGLASGASQELFRRRAADEPVSARVCISSALRHGLEHMAGRAVLMCGVLFGMFLLLMPGLVLWSSCTSLHALVAEGKGRSGTLFGELRRDAAAAPLKSTVVALSRLPLLLMLALELHLLALVVLWSAENLAGFDTALLSVELTFLGNPVYATALFLLSWLVLTPFFEAGNFLLHIDIRTRQEGLDLQYRVQRAFVAKSGGTGVPPVDGRRVGALLIVASLLMIGRPARADESQLDEVRSVRRAVETIRAEVKTTEPYPGGQRWIARLRVLGTRLARAADGDAKRFRWFDRAIEDFGDRKKDDALIVLDDVGKRLSLLEDSLTPHEPAGAEERSRRSPEEVKSMLRRTEVRKRDRTRPKEKIQEERVEPKREEEQGNEPGEDGPRTGRGGVPRASVPSGGGDLSFLGWLLLGGLGLAVLGVAVYLYMTSRCGPRTPKTPAAIGPEPLDNDTKRVLEESPAELWRQAETLAAEGRFREAVRILYLVVLSLLHRQQFIRYETARTNGEYVRQVRLSEQAPAELHSPFIELTNRFESKWYGEPPCESDDYRACRTLAEEIQKVVR